VRPAGRPLLVSAGLTALVAGLLGSLSCSASTPAPPDSPGSALRLLQTAAHTAVARPWTGTHRVVWLRGGLPRLTLVRVSHDPRTGTQSHAMDVGKLAIPSALDATKLDVLARHFDLVLAPGRAGKGVVVVEARRTGESGPGAVAGRFWLDAVTGMVVRRDVLDADGSLVRSSVLEGIALGKDRAVTSALLSSPAPVQVAERGLDEATLGTLTSQGWPIRRALPAGMDLFQAQLHDRDGGEVLQLSYTDGLSTMSLFVQPGELMEEPSGTARPVDDALVWVQPGPPERIVWSGAGRTWTMVSDAPDSTVRLALKSLPHAPRHVDDGAGARLWRGMAVVGGWLNPFS
jgi:hypothetical protein